MTDPSTPSDDQGLPKAPPVDFPPPNAAPLNGELATYGARAGGYLLDALIIIVSAGILIAVGAILKGALGALLIGVGFLWGILYPVILIPRLNGQTWGMQVTKVRCVEAATGETCGTGKALGRQVIHGLLGVFWLLSLVDLLWPLWDVKNQTLHDKAASTIVVKA